MSLEIDSLTTKAAKVKPWEERTVECPKCGIPVGRPEEGYNNNNPKARTNKKEKEENNSRIWCHFCWFAQWIKQPQWVKK
jgi:hypothetical protein